MERLFNCSLLEKLYEDRNEDLSHTIIKQSPEYKKSRKEIEEKLNEILNYVPGELYKELQDEILDFMFDHISFSLSSISFNDFLYSGDCLIIIRDRSSFLSSYNFSNKEQLNNGKSDE